MRQLSDSATRLPDPVTIGNDAERHPIPGQLRLFTALPMPDGLERPLPNEVGSRGWLLNLAQTNSYATPIL